jgi:hypothetical protein
MLHATQLSNYVRWSGVCPITISVSPSSLHLYIRLHYTWINQDRKSINLTAPTYIDYVMTWVQNLLDDGKTFPTKSGTLFVTQTSESGALTPCRARFPSEFPHHGQTRVSSAPSSVCTHIPRTLSSNFASSFRTTF